MTLKLMAWASLRRFKPVFVTLGWGTSMAAAVLYAIFHGFLLPQYKGAGLPEVALYVGIFIISSLAAVVLADFGKALASFFGSYVVGAIVTYFVLALPGYTGAFPFVNVIIAVAVIFTFIAFFPILLFAGLLGTLAGSFLAERLL